MDYTKGRNLLLKSSTNLINLWSTAANNGGTLTKESGISVSEWGASDAFRVYGKAGSTSALWGMISGIAGSSQLSIDDEPYVFSVYIKNQASAAMSISTNGLGPNITLAAGETTRVVLEATGNGVNNVQMNFSAAAKSGAFDFIYWHPKIEYGTEVTDWRPAPEDDDYEGGVSRMILARSSITVSIERGVESTYRFYKLQASTASAPAKPTTKAIPPSGWSKTEPAYTEGSTNSLYTVDLTIFTDGDFSYSDVCLSSSYEAAKQAYNKAVAAQSAASAAATTANSKNAIFYAATAPSGTHKTYDIWFDTDDDNKMYYWNGSAWTAKEFGTSALAEECITADLLAANSVTADKIVARSITAAKIATATITANEIAANTITADKMSVTELSAIAADLGSITGGSLNIGNGNFTVTSDGAMTSKTGSIANWTISEDQIYKAVVTGGYEYRTILNAPTSISGSTNAIATATRTNDGSTTGNWTYPFYVRYDGYMYSTSGKIAGWNIGQSSLSSTSPTGNLVDIANGSNTHQDVLVVRTGAGTTASPYKYPFYLRATGFLHTENLEATGGTIGGWTIASDKLYKTFTSSGGSSITISLNPSLNGISVLNSAYNREIRITPDGVFAVNTSTGAIAQINENTIGVSASGYASTISPYSIITNGTISAGDSITSGGSIWTEQSTKTAQANCGINHTGLGGLRCYITVNGSSQGIYSSGYYNGSAYSESGLWLLERGSDGRVKVPSYSGTRSYPIVSNSTAVGNRVGGLICNTATQLSIYGDWKATDGSAKYMYVTVSSSDPRLKDNIASSEMSALDIIDKIQMHSFDWKADDKHWDVGFIAPELYKIDPNLAIKPEDENEGYWGVDDFYLTGIQTKAIQELHAEIKALKGRIAELELKKGA